MSGPPVRSFEEILLHDLKIYTDEPDPSSNFFDAEIFAETISSFILDVNLPTPYVIGLDGEWGSGKTTLLKKTFNLINSKKAPVYTTVWFNSWKYEKYDSVLALYQHIIEELQKTKGSIKSDLKDVLLITGMLASDVLSRKFLGIKLEEIQSKYEKAIADVKTIQDKLDENIGNNGRLIVFIDDLDRCENENILSILSNVKEVLNSKNTVFILGIDMKKIEVAWDIKHKGYEIAKTEGRDHVDKLFQLKVRIPPKSKSELMKYVASLVSGLPDKENQLIAKTVKENPRRIKLILNTMYFLAKQMQMAKTSPDDLPTLLIITLLSVIHNEIFQIIKRSPVAFFDAIFTCLLCLDHKELRNNIESINNILSSANAVDLHGGRLNRINVSKGGNEILNLIEKDENDFEFFLNVAGYLGIIRTKNRGEMNQQMIEKFSELIKKTPFLS